MNEGARTPRRALEQMPGVRSLEVRVLDAPEHVVEGVLVPQLGALLAHPCARSIRRLHLDAAEQRFPPRSHSIGLLMMRFGMATSLVTRGRTLSPLAASVSRVTVDAARG